MNIGELKKYIADIPDGVNVCFCTNGGNLYNDYWEAKGAVRIYDIEEWFDRFVLVVDE